MTSCNLNRTPTQKMKKFVFNSEKCIYILSTWHLCCFASFAQPVFCFVCFFLIFFWVTCQLTWLYQPIVTNIWFKSEWTWKIRNDIKTTVVMEELYWKFSWWEIFGWLDSLYFTKRLNHLLLTEVFFLFSFLHCMEAISPLIHVKVDVVQLQCRGWTRNGATGCEQKKQSVSSWTQPSPQLQKYSHYL